MGILEGVRGLLIWKIHFIFVNGNEDAEFLGMKRFRNPIDRMVLISKY